jgi:hypothetical protein
MCIIIQKKLAYLKYLQTKSAENRADYKTNCTTAKKETRKINRESWDKNISNREYYVTDDKMQPSK